MVEIRYFDGLVTSELVCNILDIHPSKILNYGYCNEFTWVKIRF